MMTICRLEAHATPSAWTHRVGTFDFTVEQALGDFTGVPVSWDILRLVVVEHKDRSTTRSASFGSQAERLPLE
jgi:hypothetical protein